MKAIEFKEQTVIIAKDQPEYFPLPANMQKGESCETTFCWRPSLRERVKLLFTGRLWHTVLTFEGRLQPQRLSVTKPPLADSRPTVPDHGYEERREAEREDAEL